MSKIGYKVAKTINYWSNLNILWYRPKFELGLSYKIVITNQNWVDQPEKQIGSWNWAGTYSNSQSSLCWVSSKKRIKDWSSNWNINSDCSFQLHWPIYLEPPRIYHWRMLQFSEHENKMWIKHLSIYLHYFINTDR